MKHYTKFILISCFVLNIFEINFSNANTNDSQTSDNISNSEADSPNENRQTLIINKTTNLEDLVQEYDAKDLDFWEESIQAIKEKKYEFAYELAENHLQKKNSNIDAEIEYQIIRNLSLEGMGYQNLSIIKWFELIHGKQIKSEKDKFIFKIALWALQKLAKNNWDEFENIYAKSFFSVQDLSSEFQSFVSFHRRIYGTQIGLNKWLPKDLKNIQKQMYWLFRSEFMSISSVNEASNFIKKYSELINIKQSNDENLKNPENNENIDYVLKHHWNRLMAQNYTELQNYETAEDYYSRLSFQPLEAGEIFLERSNNLYLKKDYSNALGILLALDAPIFEKHRLKKYFDLKIKILKELCYFDLVQEEINIAEVLIKMALKNSENASKAIKNNFYIYWLLQNKEIAPLGRSYIRLIEEKRSWDLFVGNNKFRLKYSETYQLKINEIYQNLQKLYIKYKYQADSYFKTWQSQLNDISKEINKKQIQLKTSKIEKKSDKNTNLNFPTASDLKNQIHPMDISENQEIINLKKAFWPFSGEIWMDEIGKYQVILEPKCE